MNARDLIRIGGFFLLILAAHSEIILNEIVASNDPGGHLSAEGSAYDWIELHNTGDTEVDLNGLHLTDDPTTLNKWQFPRNLLVPAGGYVIVYASDRNGLFAGEEHTNFKLNGGDGEYLALVANDGTTILDEFAPGFPPLVLHRSFGPPTPGSTPALLLEATPNAANSAAGPRPIIHSFTSSAEIIAGGEPITITWATENSDNVTLQGSIHTRTTLTPVGTLTLRPDYHQTFTLTARNEYGIAQQTLAISVSPAIRQFSATPTTIATGGKTLLRWSSIGTNHINSLNGLSGSAISSPLLFTPTNETLVEPDATWRKAPDILPEDWQNVDFDDGGWVQIQGPIDERGNYRTEFQLPDPAALTAYTISVPNGPGLGISLNGTPLPSSETHLLASPSGHEIPVDPSLLIPGKNILTFSLNNTLLEHPVKLAAWRPQPGPVEVPVVLNSQNDAGKDSETVTITVLPPDSPLPPLATVAITEFFWAYAGTIPEWPYRFLEIHNFGNEPIDLTSHQLVGITTFSFVDASDPILNPGEYAVIVSNHPAFAEKWPGDRNVIGQFEKGQQKATYHFKCQEGILDPFGRLFEFLDLSKIGVGNFLETVERIDVHQPFHAPDNWDILPTMNYNDMGQGTPGEARFRILNFSFTPEFASPGDPVTLNWKVSGEATLTGSDGIGPLTGLSGSIPLIVPEDARSFDFYLAAQTLFQFYWERADLLLPPAIAYFNRSKTSITPGDEVQFSWGLLNDYSSYNSTIDPELPNPVYGNPRFTPLISGFSAESYWRYYASPDGPPENWTSPEGAQGWRAGYTPLGFGKDDLGKELTPSDWISINVHKSFVVREVEEINALFLDLLADDGVVVYLNGIEVLRRNLPGGIIDHLTPALGPAANNGMNYETFEIDPTHLIEGENVIAAAIHNVAIDDPDLVFDLGLRAQRPIPPNGRKNYTLTSSNIAGTASAEVTILFEEPIMTPAWQNELGLTGDPAITDSDGDGLSDLMEFATGSDPLAPSPAPLQVTMDDDQYIILTYPHNLLAGDVVPYAQVSDDLTNWSNLGGRTTGMTFRHSIAPDGSPIAEVRYQSYAPMRSGQRYFRLIAR